MKKLVIFDLDGVLYDSSAIAFEGLRAIFPDLTEDIMNEILTGNFHEEIKKLTLSKAEVTEEERQLRKEKYTKLKSEAPLFPGIKELLQEVKGRNISLGLNTSATRNNCVPLLERQGVFELFDYIGTKEEGESKAVKFTLILDTFLLKPEEVVFVTDTLGDLREAESVGIPTIAVTYGAHSREFFMREPHTNLVAIVDTVEELQRLLSLE